MYIIALDDGKAGHKSQLNGVMNYLSEYKSTNFTLQSSLINYLPFWLYKFFCKFELSKQIIAHNDCFTIIAVGKRTLCQALFIKFLLQRAHKNVKLIYLMPPSFKDKYIDKIDLIFYHSYKSNNAFKYNDKFVAIPMAPHNLNIDNIVLGEKFTNLRHPIYTILIGGDAKSIKFTTKSVDSLLLLLIQINNKHNNQATFLISTSARTSAKVSLYLKEVMCSSLLTYQLFLYNKEVKNNPYKEILACGDNIIVSGESISMLSECCSLIDKNLYVFFNKSFYAKRYSPFHKMLYQNHYANPCEDILTLIEPHNKINITSEVALKIKKIVQ